MTLSVDDVRVFTKDTVLDNVLLEGKEQSDDDLIELAMNLAVQLFNSVAPVTQYSVESFPNDTILLYGTLYHLALSESERQLRNEINFQTQGMNVAIDNKHQQYVALATTYRQLFDAETKAYKMYINTEQAWGEDFSPYANINEFLFRM
jgi:hypothetical protein